MSPERRRRAGHSATVGRFGRRAARAALAATIAAVVASTVAMLVSAGWLSGARARVDDALTFPRGTATDDLAVVAIDADSVQRVGEAWPWSRDTQATLVEAITAAGARVMVLDVVLAPAGVGDDRLAAALGAVPSVIGIGIEADANTDRAWSDRGVLVARSAISPEPGFAAAAVGAHTAVTPDGSDGVTRHVPLVVDVDRRFVPALALAALALANGDDPRVTVRPTAVQVGTRTIPTDRRHRLRVSYTDELSGADDAAVVPAADVLAGHTGTQLRDKVVFVGVTDPTAGDRLLTPMAKRSGTAGVLVHANAFNTMHQRTYLRSASVATVAAIAALLALLVATATLLTRPWIGAATAVASGAALIVAGSATAARGTLVDALTPLLGVAVTFTIAAVARELLVDRQRRRLAGLFTQYVPPRVAREIIASNRTSELLDGARLDVTVVFCDIRGFTPATAVLDAPQVRALLDSYYQELSAVVLDHGGTVLQYTGDEILAVFGAPLAVGDHERAAVDCAQAMHAARSTLASRLATVGLPALDYGIGIQTGSVVSAVMGSAIRRQYGLVGTTVVLGARLCSAAGAGDVVISDATWHALDDPPVAATETVALKGVDGPTTVHRIRRRTDQPTRADA